MVIFVDRATAQPPAVDSPSNPGATWAPEGVTVIERYGNQTGAIVLVYTAAKDYRHNTACLGCHFAQSNKARGKPPSLSGLDLDEAAEAANAHATTCRALPRQIPARPDDDTVRQRLRTWASCYRHRSNDVEVDLSDLDPIRLALQRTNDWLETALQQMAFDHPDLLTAHSGDRNRPRYYIRCNTPS